jgi:hypothetical protein
MMGKQLHRQHRVETVVQTICLVSYLEAENERLRRVARELSLEITALRQRLNRMNGHRRRPEPAPAQH